MNDLKKLNKYQTYLKLGLVSLLKVFTYRLKIKSKFFKKSLPISDFEKINLIDLFESAPSLSKKSSDFLSCLSHEWRDEIISNANKIMAGERRYFFNHWHPENFNLELERISKNNLKHFSELNLFFSEGQDIKTIWENSRFYWFVDLAKAFRLSGEQKYLESLNNNLNSWLENNPCNAGYNWACAQEASIRLINFTLGLEIIRQGGHAGPPLQGLDERGDIKNFIQKHCARIIPVMGYADSQKNNHATSEAAGLFIAGCFLSQMDFVSPIVSCRGGPACPPGQTHRSVPARKYLLIGRKYLERQLKRLVMSDGTFAQYSVTYHRLVLDTISLCEIFRQRSNQPKFSQRFYKNYEKLFLWLYQLVDPISGDAPNLGANDGTNLFKLECLDYRDFRPSLQLASVLINKTKCFEPGPWDEVLDWLELEKNPGEFEFKTLEKKSREFKAGGLVSIVFDSAPSLSKTPDGLLSCLSREGRDESTAHTHCLLRTANFKFRPSQSDCFHLDLFHKGVNILRDGGSYSYNTDPNKIKYYSGTASHNTIMFDDHDQMPKLSRFLFGDWLKIGVGANLVFAHDIWRWSGEYKDYLGCRHQRSLEINQNLGIILVRDEISGFKNHAVLTWRLAPDLNWMINKSRKNLCESDLASFEIFIDQEPVELNLSRETESKYYQKETRIPVLNIKIEKQSRSQVSIKTKIKIKDPLQIWSSYEGLTGVMQVGLLNPL